ncbi:DUF1934 domain-containing protein [Ruminococcaceae bacterium OttesenSCG-928-A16]|nr:DUF1934 domain-containing protein [Ruminococcaceae bacterium OttesenSCG-928-A16]
MREDYLISIKGTMLPAGETEKDTVELVTRGGFVRRNGKFFISYAETEATGYQGNVTTVRVEDGHKVSMLRHGSAPSQLIIERGKRHVCHYDTSHGSLSLGVAADEIDNRLTEHGGEITFSYTLDSGQEHLSHNQVKITVQEAD